MTSQLRPKLRFLLTHDAEWAPFYSERISHFEHLEVITDENPGAMVDPRRSSGATLDTVGLMISAASSAITRWTISRFALRFCAASGS